MLTYNLEKTHGPLYIALYEAIKDDIIKKRIRSGEKLPSKRVMAGNNGLSPITVENAYALLLSEGYIKSKPKSGFFVDDIPHEIFQITEEKGNKQNPRNDEKSIIIDYSKSIPPSSLFPFDDWLKATRNAVKNEKENLLLPPPSEGTPALRKTIKRYLKEYRALDVDENMIIIGAGSEYLYSLLILLLGREKTFAVENPGHLKEELIYRTENVKVEYLPLDGSGVIPATLVKKKVDILHITPSHQYPTGIVMPVSRRYELLSWAAGKKGRYIIEDDYDSELRLQGNPVPSLKAADTTGSVIYMNTFSQTLSPTIRISYMALPEDLYIRYREKFSFYSSTVSSFEQYTLSEFISSGSMEKHISRLRTSLRRKRDIFIKALKASRIKDIIEISGERAGGHFILRIKSEKDEEEIMKKAEDMKIILSPLSSFYHGEKPPENTFLMNYSSLDNDKIELTIKVLTSLYLD